MKNEKPVEIVNLFFLNTLVNKRFKKVSKNEGSSCDYGTFYLANIIIMLKQKCQSQERQKKKAEKFLF